MPLRPMIFGDCGQDDLEKVDVFWRRLCHSVRDPEVLLAALGLLHFIELSAQEVG